MIQDIFPHKLNNQYDPTAQALPGDTAFCFDGSKLLIRRNADSTAELPTVSMFGGSSTYLFTVDDERFFLVPVPEAIPEGFEWMEIFILRREAPLEKHRIFAALTGKHLADWYRDTHFCGRCGGKMAHSETERAMKCACGNTVYPRIMPAVIVGVKNGDKLLLTKYRRGYSNYAMIAGFTEIGETLEETVAREVMEEAGIRVKNIRYYKSQPWGIPNDILMGFYCELDGCDEIRMDTQELKLAQWVQREEIELQPDDFSLTNEMMYMFKTGREK